MTLDRTMMPSRPFQPTDQYPARPYPRCLMMNSTMNTAVEDVLHDDVREHKLIRLGVVPRHHHHRVRDDHQHDEIVEVSVSAKHRTQRIGMCRRSTRGFLRVEAIAFPLSQKASPRGPPRRPVFSDPSSMPDRSLERLRAVSRVPSPADRKLLLGAALLQRRDDHRRQELHDEKRAAHHHHGVPEQHRPSEPVHEHVAHLVPPVDGEPLEGDEADHRMLSNRIFPLAIACLTVAARVRRRAILETTRRTPPGRPWHRPGAPDTSPGPQLRMSGAGHVALPRRRPPPRPGPPSTRRTGTASHP